MVQNILFGVGPYDCVQYPCMNDSWAGMQSSGSADSQMTVRM